MGSIQCVVWWTRLQIQGEYFRPQQVQATEINSKDGSNQKRWEELSNHQLCLGGKRAYYLMKTTFHQLQTSHKHLLLLFLPSFQSSPFSFLINKAQFTLEKNLLTVARSFFTLKQWGSEIEHWRDLNQMEVMAVVHLLMYMLH